MELMWSGILIGEYLPPGWISKLLGRNILPPENSGKYEMPQKKDKYKSLHGGPPRKGYDLKLLVKQPNKKAKLLCDYEPGLCEI